MYYLATCIISYIHSTIKSKALLLAFYTWLFTGEIGFIKQAGENQSIEYKVQYLTPSIKTDKQIQTNSWYTSFTICTIPLNSIT